MNEAGTDIVSYRNALADAIVSVRTFQTSAEATRSPALTDAIDASLHWYQAAADVWTARVSDPFYLGFCDAETRVEFRVNKLCGAYPELVRKVPSKAPSAGTSTRFAERMINLEILLSGAILDKTGKPEALDQTDGIVFETAQKEATERADLDLDHATAIIEGRKPADLTGRHYQLSDRDLLLILVSKAKSN